jgi:hypothetical protein
MNTVSLAKDKWGKLETVARRVARDLIGRKGVLLPNHVLARLTDVPDLQVQERAHHLRPTDPPPPRRWPT